MVMKQTNNGIKESITEIKRCIEISFFFELKA